MEEKKLSRKQELAIVALLELPTATDVAEHVGVNPKTLYRWQSEPHFKAAYRKARHEAMGSAIARLQQASNEAVDTLRDVMGDQEATPASRVTAARAVLELGLRATELELVDERLARLEEQAGLR
ncbi:MAG: hypothetical protein GX228_08680 [Firmicutes bacterium]|nr:hypothetical protein [Bacillota bacterium]